MRRLVACLAITIIVALPATPAFAADINAEPTSGWSFASFFEEAHLFSHRILGLLSGLHLPADSPKGGPAVGQSAQRLGPTIDPDGYLSPEIRVADDRFNRAGPSYGEDGQ